MQGGQRAGASQPSLDPFVLRGPATNVVLLKCTPTCFDGSEAASTRRLRRRPHQLRIPRPDPMSSKAKKKAATQRLSGPWLIHFFKRHQDDDASEAVPGRAFLDDCPPSIRAKLIAIIKAVADAPPPMFSGGGKWEAMHDKMGGLYEARADGEGREHFRLFCMLARDGAAVGLGGPSLIIITGMRKPFRTAFSTRDYQHVRALGNEFLKRSPRSIG